jgi:hypothetical protein
VWWVFITVMAMGEAKRRRKMDQPRRHDATARNRRKALHHAECLQSEIEFVDRDLRRMSDNMRYALGRVARIINRLKSEVEADKADNIK